MIKKIYFEEIKDHIIVTYQKNRNRICYTINCLGKLEVKAPYFVNEKTIKELIKLNLNQTYQKINFYKQKFDLDKDFIYLFNKKYKLVIDNESKFNKYKILENTIEIKINNKISKEQMVLNIFKKELLKYILEKIDIYAKNMHTTFQSIKIKKMKKAWGKCDSKNNLSFSCFLAIFNKKIINYVIIHELSHTIHKNHSKEFWNCVKKYCLNYKQYHLFLKQY